MATPGETIGLAAIKQLFRKKPPEPDGPCLHPYHITKRYLEHNRHQNIHVLAATSVNADVFRIDNKTGRIKRGLFADIIAVEGNPAEDISQIRKIAFVMKGGQVYRKE